MTEIIESPDGNELLLDSRSRLVRSKGIVNQLPIKTLSVSAYELRLSDVGCRLLFTAGCTVTVPPSSKVPFTDGSIQIVQYGSSQVTLVADGVTIHTPETLITAKQYATVVLTVDAADVFTLAGYLEAA